MYYSEFDGSEPDDNDDYQTELTVQWTQETTIIATQRIGFKVALNNNPTATIIETTGEPTTLTGPFADSPFPLTITYNFICTHVTSGVYLTIVVTLILEGPGT